MGIDIGKLIKNVSQIKLKGGIFTKASIVIIIVSLCLFGIAFKTNNIWISCGTIGLIFILAFIILWRLINFANKNPQAAILEGAEFLIHEQIELAAKGISEIPKLSSDMTEDNPVVIDTEQIKLVNKPDENKGKEATDG